MIVRLAGSGDVLGLSAMLNNLAHEVTAETIEPTQLKSVPKQEFLELLNTFSEVGKKTAEALAREHRAVFLEARRLALLWLRAGRLAQLLIECARAASCGQPEPLLHRSADPRRTSQYGRYIPRNRDPVAQSVRTQPFNHPAWLFTHHRQSNRSQRTHAVRSDVLRDKSGCRRSPVRCLASPLPVLPAMRETACSLQTGQ